MTNSHSKYYRFFDINGQLQFESTYFMYEDIFKDSKIINKDKYDSLEQLQYMLGFKDHTYNAMMNSHPS